MPRSLSLRYLLSRRFLFQICVFSIRGLKVRLLFATMVVTKIIASQKTGTSHATIFCNNFMLPKRRFWKSDEHLGTRFRSAFQKGEYSIWATFLWKVVRSFDPKRSLGHPKSSFREHKLYKTITKESRIPWNSTSHVATIFCNHLAKLLQKIVASHETAHHMLLLSFVIILQSVTKDSRIPENQHITCCYYLL